MSIFQRIRFLRWQKSTIALLTKRGRRGVRRQKIAALKRNVLLPVWRGITSRVAIATVTAVLVCCMALTLSNEQPRTVQAIVQVLFEKSDSIAITTAAFIFFLEIPERRKREHSEAWQVINSAQGQGGNGGRIQALEYLSKENVKLDGVTTPFADLTGINLAGSSLVRANFEKAKLDKANFRDANLEYADLRSTSLQRAIFSGAHLHFTDFREANLEGANFQEATLYEADFREARFGVTCFRNASLTGADFRNAQIFGVDFTGADLSSADFRGTSVFPALVQVAENWDHAQYDDDFYKELKMDE